MVGSLQSLRIVLDKCNKEGVAFGYSLIKCQLITKAEFVGRATQTSGIDLDLFDGHRFLGKSFCSDS